MINLLNMKYPTNTWSIINDIVFLNLDVKKKANNENLIYLLCVL